MTKLTAKIFISLCVFVAGCDEGEPSTKAEGVANLVIHSQAKPVAEVAFLQERQGRVLVVNYWATWCAPCRVEMPSLATLQEHYPQEIEVVAVSLDRGDIARPQAFLQEVGASSLTLIHDSDSITARALGVAGLPTTLVINQEGKEVARLLGEAQWDSPPIYAFLDALLYEPASASSSSGMAVKRSATKP